MRGFFWVRGEGGGVCYSRPGAGRKYEKRALGTKNVENPRLENHFMTDEGFAEFFRKCGD